MNAEAARRGWSALLGLAKPLYVARLHWRARREPLYGQAIGERFGRYAGTAPAPGALWLHAVSLGETRAAASLIGALRAELGDGMRLLLTHGTATGRAAGAALLKPGDAQAWLPFDTPAAVGRFLDRFAPCAGVLMETEVWPNLLHAAEQRRVPIVLANARLSAQSLARARRFKPLLRPAAARIALALAQTEADAERLRAAGVARVELAGNLKYDMTPDAALVARGRAWRAALARPVLHAASTREGEEAQLLDAFVALPPPRPLLLLVPRHPQRFDAVAALLAQRGLRTVRRSAWGEGAGAAPAAGDADADVWLGDSLGEMPLYYAAGDVALLGGSFAPLGGQNLIEAAACGSPLIAGPHTFNFADAAERSIAAGAALRATSLDDALRQALALLDDAPARAAMSSAALQFAAAHRGAARAMARRIAALMRPE